MRTELRFVVAIILMVGVLVVTNRIFPPVPPPVGVGRDIVSAPSATQPATPEAEPVQPPVPASVGTDTADPERHVVVAGPLYRHVFSTRGARLVSAELLAFRSFTRDGPVQLIADTVLGALGMGLVAGADTFDLRDASFTPSSESVTVPDGATARLSFRHERPGLVVEVTYLFRSDSYLMDVTGSMRGLDRVLLIADLGTGLALNDVDAAAESRALAYVGNHLQRGIDSNPLRDVDRPTIEEGPFLWAAIRSKFFVFAVLPGADGIGPEHLGGILVRPDDALDRAHVAVTESVADGVFGYRAFAGPQEYARLTAIGSDLDEVNPYGWRVFRPIIRPLVGIITAVLIFLHDSLNLAHGWVLVLFGLLMRVVLWPFNQKAMRAQMKNMAVQPMLKEIQTKYKDNPEKLQKEMLRLYKDHGFNPMAGCLPMLLPWPVLISLFFVFQNTIEFRGASFFWIPDLSAPDPVYLLPVFLGLSMFLLQRISMRSMPPNPQMKMMLWIMPIMMVFIFFNLAAGLNLYYAVSNIATIPQQYWIAREREKAQALDPLKPRTS